MVNKDPIKSMLDFHDGLVGGPRSRLPGADTDPDIQRGMRMRNSGRSEPQPAAEKQSFADAIGTLLAMVLTVVGLFVGASIGGWIGALALGAIGFIAGLAIVWTLESWIKGMAEKRLWRARGHDHTSEKLRSYWQARFDSELDEELIDDIDESGSAWVMDRKGNFILRMRSGQKLSIRQNIEGDIAVTQPGRQFTPADAYRMALVRASAGETSMRPTTGNKKAKALMWAAAKLVGLDTGDYRPDALALRTLDEMRRQFPERRPKG